MISFLTALFAAIPELISIIKLIVKYIQDEQDKAAKKALAKDISDALKEAVDSGSTKKIEDIFRTGNQ